MSWLSLVRFCFLMLPFALCSAQSQSRTISPGSEAQAITAYTLFMAHGTRLYNGVEYNEMQVNPQDVGHPYFLSDDWETGSVEYDGATFSNILLMYDVLQDKIVVENTANSLKQELIKEKVNSFSIDGHIFVKLAGDSLSENSVRPGFYEVLYDGTTDIFIRRKKTVDKKIIDKKTLQTFNTRDQFYVYTQNRYHQVKSKSSMLKVFSNQKNALKKELASQNIRFKNNREQYLAALGRAYDEIKRQP